MTRVSIGGTEVRELREPLFNYESTTPDGKHIRVTLLPVMVEGTPVAYLAINYDLTELIVARRAIAQLTRTEPQRSQIQETFLSSTPQIRQLIQSCAHDLTGPLHGLTPKQRMLLVQRLQEKGILRMRGAVREIATQLGVSRAAVYNYLKAARPSERNLAIERN
jgi:predicted transcriptional regulator YheO